MCRKTLMGTFFIFLFIVIGSRQAKAETRFSYLIDISYLNVTAGTYGFGLGALLESSLLSDTGFGLNSVGVEYGVSYLKRALQAGKSNVGFNTFHAPVSLKFHFLANYAFGLGYYYDISTDNRSLIYGPKISFLAYVPNSDSILGLHFSDWIIGLHYLMDQAQQGAFDTLILNFGIRY